MSDPIRVRDKDTGHERTIPALHLPHGNYEVLKDQPAVDPRTGDDVPPKYGKPQASPKASPTPAGGPTLKKEND